MTDKRYSDAELALMPAIQIGPGHFRNPFAATTDTPDGFDLSRRWAQLHWPEGFEDTSAPAADGFSAIGDALAIKRSGMHRTEGGTAGSAFFPVQARDIDAWEQSCQEMHDNQEMQYLEPKPLADGGIRGKRQVVRGD